MSKSWKRRIAAWIPGIISGGADNDPSGIATYFNSGARFGYGQVWLLLLSTPMLISVQAMCARLGNVTRKGLMTVLREHYPPSLIAILSIVLIGTNTTTLAANLVGMADAIGLATATGVGIWILPVSAVMWYIILFKNHTLIEKYFLFFVVIFSSYIFSAIVAKPDWRSVFFSIIRPSFPWSLEYFVAGLGLLGTTITPFLFFWQSRQGTEEHKTKEELLTEAKTEDRRMAPGLIFSNVISLAIVLTAGATMNGSGSLAGVSAADAARALEPLAGPLAKYLFALGIIASGFIAVPILATSTAYIVAEVFGWKESLSEKVNKEKGFYTVLSASLLVGMGIAYSNVEPMRALVYSQVVNGMIAPFLIILILKISRDKKIMGTYVNPRFDTIFGWITVLVMLGGTVGLLWQMLK
ncbi:MAG: Nramp family divalent metal transporter [bacterium]|nr:Nramp family divalent metal transporter [bacterium]